MPFGPGLTRSPLGLGIPAEVFVFFFIGLFAMSEKHATEMLPIMTKKDFSMFFHLLFIPLHVSMTW